MRHFRFLFPVLVVVAASLFGAATPSLAQSKIEKLLGEMGVPMAKVQDGLWKASYTFQGDTETVLLREIQLGDKPNDSLKLIQLIDPLVGLGEGAKVPAPALNKAMELSGDLTVGKVVVWPDGILYISEMWYTTANSDTLENELILATLNGKKARGILQPFFKE